MQIGGMLSNDVFFLFNFDLLQGKIEMQYVIDGFLMQEGYVFLQFSFDVMNFVQEIILKIELKGLLIQGQE